MEIDNFKILADELSNMYKKADVNPPVLYTDVFSIISSIINKLASIKKKFFSDFSAKLNFSAVEYNFEKELISRIQLAFLFYLKIIKSNFSIYVSNDDLEFVFYTLQKLIITIDKSYKPYLLFNINAKLSAFSKVSTNSNNLLPKITLIVQSKISNEKTTYFLCINEENKKVLLKLYDVWDELYKIVWEGAKLNLFNVQVKYTEYIIISAGKDSLVVLEPDYMIDATDIAECFDSVGINTNIYFLKKFTKYSISKSMILGNIINSLFDELLTNMYCDFNSAFENALLSKPLSSFTLALSKPEESKQLRSSAAEHFEKIRLLIPLIKDGILSVEPTFISPLYGIKGRLDLLQEFEDQPQKKNIIELKSGKAPSLDYFYKSHSSSVRTGLWMNHLAQTTCYNLLLDTAFEERTGTTTILYSVSSNTPFRAAPNIFRNKQEVILARNRITAMEKLLSEDNYVEIMKLRPNLFGSIPSFSESELVEFTLNFDRLDELEKMYFLKNIGFIFREISASNVGAYTSNPQKAGISLWQGSINNPNIIENTNFNYDSSDIEKGYLTFNLPKNINHTLRFGDSVVLFPKSKSKKIYNEQIIKAVIKDISNELITLSVRNKMIKWKMFSDNLYWNIATDYSDSLLKKNLKQFSNFLYTDKKYRSIILGITEPEFNNINYIDYSELSEIQNSILRKAVSARNYFLIQGPPGTGKTSFMLKYIAKYLFENTSENVLLLAYTNRAVDEICKALTSIGEGFSFLRLGSKESTIYKEHSFTEFVWQNDLQSSFNKIKKTRFFCATTSFVANNPELFIMKQFSTAIVDEAAQIIECQIVGLLTHFEKFILIGDEKQLPAVVLQDEEHLKVNNNIINSIRFDDLSNSLFARLIHLNTENNRKSSFAMLTHQARMHKDIQEFPSVYFYNNELQIFDNRKQSLPLNIFNPNSKQELSILQTLINQHRSLFLSSKSEETQKLNYSEADTITNIVELLLNEYGKDYLEENLGIISTFRLQCSIIRSKIEKITDANILIDTVERFQGSEKEIILLSLAVNKFSDLDQISSVYKFSNQIIDRKLNVALTRAKNSIVILGNELILSSSDIYNNLIKFHKEKSAFYYIQNL